MTKVHPRINNRSLCNRPFHRAGKTLNESRKVIRPGRGEGGGREVSTPINAGNQVNLEHLLDNLR